MQNFVNFIKENYVYFVYVFEFIVILISSIIAFVQGLRSKKAHSLNDYLKNMNDITISENRFYSSLPEWIHQANILYPYHGDGQRRFHYVYQKALDLFGAESSEPYREFISDCIDDILNADKVEKVCFGHRDLCSHCSLADSCRYCEHWSNCEYYKPVDTQDIEPKKEFYEKEKDVEIERSEDLRQDGEENQSAERSACYVSRRN